MSNAHQHKWKKVKETYAPPVGREILDMGINGTTEMMEKLLLGVTTILWDCEDKDCRGSRKEEMLGKA